MQSLKKGDVRGFGPGPLRVDRPETYEFLRGLLGEVAEKFPDETFHGGGDEVSNSLPLFIDNVLLKNDDVPRQTRDKHKGNAERSGVSFSGELWVLDEQPGGWGVDGVAWDG